jgi:hypothetical protein
MMLELVGRKARTDAVRSCTVRLDPNHRLDLHLRTHSVFMFYLSSRLQVRECIVAGTSISDSRCIQRTLVSE